MSGARDDGGPAFPVTCQSTLNGDAVTMPSVGMTLRDYFAANINTPDGITVAWGESIVGPYPKDSKGCPLPICRESVLWWADVEAAYRGFMADAMLRERAK